MPAFTNQFDYALDSIDNQVIEREAVLTDDLYENDIYEFKIDGRRNINLSLNNLAAGDDADLYLYEDSNNNGILDDSDFLLSSSVRSDNSDERINHEAGEGTYFARVSFHSSERDDLIEYDLDLAGDLTNVGSSTIAVEKDFSTFLIGEAAAVETGYIARENVSDTYAVSIVEGEVIDVTLSGLANDADLRVIRDNNNNNIVDEGEIYTSSSNSGFSSESVSLSERGEYFVEVFQYAGNTDYTLQFDQEFV